MSHDGECASGLPRHRALILSMVLLTAALNTFGPDLRGQGWSSGIIRGNRMGHSPDLNPGKVSVGKG